MVVVVDAVAVAVAAAVAVIIVIAAVDVAATGAATLALALALARAFAVRAADVPVVLVVVASFFVLLLLLLMSLPLVLLLWLWLWLWLSLLFLLSLLVLLWLLLLSLLLLMLMWLPIVVATCNNTLARLVTTAPLAHCSYAHKLDSIPITSQPCSHPKRVSPMNPPDFYINSFNAPSVRGSAACKRHDAANHSSLTQKKELGLIWSALNPKGPKALCSESFKTPSSECLRS